MRERMMLSRAIAYWCGLAGFLAAAVLLAGLARGPVVWGGGVLLVAALCALDLWARRHDDAGRLGTKAESSFLAVASVVLLGVAFLSRGTPFASWLIPLLAAIAFASVLGRYVLLARPPESAD